MRKGYNKGILLVETITKSEELEEVESLCHILKMTNFPPVIMKITGTHTKEDFIKLFTRENSKKRYVHISSHAGKNGFFIHGARNTSITISDFKEYDDELEEEMKGRFLTISACGLSDKFLKNLHKLIQFEAVISPMNEVDFDESAIFFINFYFNLSRIERSIKNTKKEVKLIDFIDTFQKTKIGYLLQGGLGGMRLLYNTGEPGKLATII